MTFRQIALAGVAAIGMAAVAPAARADVIQLGFILDQSGSIDATEWGIIRSGLASAINLIPVAGPNTYEVSVVKFSDTAQTVVNRTLIDSVATRTAVSGTIGAMAQSGTFTNYELGFDLMQTVLTTGGNLPTLSYVNFATDGDPNRCGGVGDATTSPGLAGSQACAVAARNAIIAAGIDNISIEGIGLTAGGASEAFLKDSICYPGPCDATVPYDFPAKGFYIGVANATAYAEAIQGKILTVTEQVPEPATMAVLGMGLLGLGLARRRRG